MDLPINRNKPYIMHIDLNSAFASIEQQAYPHLRGKPIAVAAYNSPRACVIAPSIEAKTYGVKVGHMVQEAKLLCPGLIVRTPDPAKYRTVHTKFRDLFKEYSPDVVPKSIDEAVINFEGTPILRNKNLIEVGFEIKKRMKDEIGDWLRCSIGISTNRFLAKTAASLHKPDGLDVIDNTNLEKVYSHLNLIDLCGINTRFQARLNASGIYTPLEFFKASEFKLRKEVFKSITGYYWYLRLKGWEIDAVDFGRKSFGNSYALGKKTSDKRDLGILLLKLCEKTGRRIRHNNFKAYGIHVSFVYEDWTYWHKGKTLSQPVYTTSEIYVQALKILNLQPETKIVREIAVSVFNLNRSDFEQTDIFETDKSRLVADAMDVINDKYGEFVITPALMMGMKETILDRVAFGGVRELEDIYSSM
jgi:DNA polymerase-4